MPIGSRPTTGQTWPSRPSKVPAGPTPGEPGLLRPASASLISSSRRPPTSGDGAGSTWPGGRPTGCWPSRGCLVERNPENPDSHLLLADAYQQVNKNAWQTGDRATIVPYLERAIAENQRALILDPDSPDARHAMDRRRRRLKDLLAPQAEVRTPARAGSDGSRGL